MLTRNDVKLLWHDRYYDGPISGALEWEGKRYYFRQTADSLYDEDRTYDIIDLPEDVWAEHDERHADFRRYVGTHCDYTEEGNKRAVGVGVNPDRDEWTKFYDKYKDTELNSTGPVVGQWGYGG